MQGCSHASKSLRCTKRHISSDNYQRRRPALGACGEALEDSSRQMSSLFHAWILDPTTVKGDASALIHLCWPQQPLAFLGSHFFSDSCARVYPWPAPCCAKVDWLNRTMVNLLWMFHAPLDLPAVAALIAPLLLVWLPGGSQPGPRDGKSS